VTARAEGTSRHYRFSGGAAGSERLWPIVREELLNADGTRHDLERVKSVIAERRSRSKAFFSSAAGEWERLRGELFGPRTELHGLLALLNADWTVGDLGCGTGGLAALVAPFVRRVVAVDDSAAMLEAARQRLHGSDNVDLREGALEALPVEDGALDVALLFLVLHHVSEPVGVLREVRRTVGAGGRLVIVDMMAHQREELRAEMGHVWLGFRPQQLTGWLEEAGMTATRQMPLPAHPGATGPTLFVATAKVPAARPAGDQFSKLESVTP
jgi:ArsR family transcriptional regulator